MWQKGRPAQLPGWVRVDITPLGALRGVVEYDTGIGGVVAARGGTRSWRRRQRSCSRVVRRGCIVLWSTQRSPRVFATMGKTHLILGYPWQHIYGFGLLWAHNHRGFRPPPWAKITSVWATKDKNHPCSGYHWQNFIWVWATMDTEPPAGWDHGQKLLELGLFLDLGHHGQTLAGVGLLWAQNPRGFELL